MTSSPSSPGALAPPVARAFPAEPASVPAARRFLRQLLADRGGDEWSDEAQLALSEIATNAVLHAHTAFEVTVQTAPYGLYVQVWDDDATPPARRVSDADSTTGRGLELVAAVATAYGVQVVGPSKVVWFSIGIARPDDAEDVLLDRWRDREPGEDPASGPSDAQPVVLKRMPLALWLSAREHHNTLMREFSLHQQAVRPPASATLDGLAAADRARSVVLAAVRLAGAGPTAELVLRVRPDQAAWFEALRDVLDAAEALASAGELLAPPGPPAVVEVRRWAVRQVLDQLAGAAPSAWDGPVSLDPAATTSA